VISSSSQDKLAITGSNKDSPSDGTGGEATLPISIKPARA